MRGFSNWFSKRLRRFATNHIMDTTDVSPSLPRSEQARKSVSESVLECRYHDAASRTRHPLHISENERSSNTVCLASASSCNDDRDIGTDELCEALRFIEVHFMPDRWTNLF